jgi:hypothetical protein
MNTMVIEKFVKNNYVKSEDNIAFNVTVSLCVLINVFLRKFLHGSKHVRASKHISTVDIGNTCLGGFSFGLCVNTR